MKRWPAHSNQNEVSSSGWFLQAKVAALITLCFTWDHMESLILSIWHVIIMSFSLLMLTCSRCTVCILAFYFAYETESDSVFDMSIQCLQGRANHKWLFNPITLASCWRWVTQCPACLYVYIMTVQFWQVVYKRLAFCLHSTLLLLPIDISNVKYILKQHGPFAQIGQWDGIEGPFIFHLDCIE